MDLYEDSGITVENQAAYMADANAYGGLHPNAKGMDLITRTVYFAMCEKYLGM